MNGLLFWAVILLLLYLGYRFGLSRGAATRPRQPQATVPEAAPELVAYFQTKLAPELEISRQRSLGGVIEFDGTPRSTLAEAQSRIRAALAAERVRPLFLEGHLDEIRVLLLPEKAARPAAEKPKWWLHGLLLFLTVATTTWAGALHAGVNLLQDPARFAVGLPYSLALLLILGAHELGHYFTARRYHIDVTPPYFIPVPFALGTFGAFIRIKSLTPNRRALFDVAVAGPLAGLVFAIPALWIGLKYSQVFSAGQFPNLGHAGLNIGSSILLAIMAKLALGASVTEGHHLLLHPLAFAGWLGLMITALNLLPIGQLDGGHMAHGIFGERRAHAISVLGLVALFLLALFVWPGLMLWAFIVFFIAGTHDAPATDDVTPVGAPRRLLGYFGFLLLLLILLPVPQSLFQVVGLHSPYL